MKVELQKKYQLFIDGEWRDASDGETLKTYNPATGELLAEIADASEKDVDDAVKAGHRAFQSWSKTTVTERAAVLNKIADIIDENKEFLATVETMDNGKPITLTNPIQVERSYQYNEASVSTDDQQGDQIRDWLYDSLARRITDQYVAIALPKVTPGSSTSAQIGKGAGIKGTGSTAIVVPNP